MFDTRAFLSLFTILMIVSGSIGQDLPFKWEECQSPGLSKSLQIYNVDVFPKPLAFDKITNLFVTFNATVFEELNDNYTIVIDTKRITSGPTPVELPITTIRKSLCSFLTEEDFSSITCPLLTKAKGSSECQCPISPGTYAVNKEKVTVDLSRLGLPSIVYRLGTGNYKSDVTLTKTTGAQISQMGCLRLISHVDLNVKNHFWSSLYQHQLFQNQLQLFSNQLQLFPNFFPKQSEP